MASLSELIEQRFGNKRATSQLLLPMGMRLLLGDGAANQEIVGITPK